MLIQTDQSNGRVTEVSWTWKSILVWRGNTWPATVLKWAVMCRGVELKSVQSQSRAEEKLLVDFVAKVLVCICLAGHTLEDVRPDTEHDPWLGCKYNLSKHSSRRDVNSIILPLPSVSEPPWSWIVNIKHI